MENEQGTTQATQDVNTASSPAQTEQGQPASASVNSQAPIQSQKPENVPFGDKRHPEYRRFKELQEGTRKANERAQALERQLAEMRGWQQAQMQQRGQTVTPEQETALEQLFNLALSSPKVASMLEKRFGVDRLNNLEKEYGSFKESWEGQQYEGEMESVRKFATESGLDPDEVEDSLREHVENSPFFQDKTYRKGGVWAAFRDKYWDRLGELKERALNKQKLEEKERLEKGQTQGGGAFTPSKASLPKDPEARAKALMQQAGGIGNIDFTR